MKNLGEATWAGADIKHPISWSDKRIEQVGVKSKRHSVTEGLLETLPLTGPQTVEEVGDCRRIVGHQGALRIGRK